MKIGVQRGHCSMTLEHNGTDKIPLQDLLCDLERAVLHEILKAHDGVKARAAERLMLKRTTLVEKTRKYGFPIKK